MLTYVKALWPKTRAVLAITIVGGYIAGTLSGISEAANLKEAAIMVTGWYFYDRVAARSNGNGGGSRGEIQG
jgi:hypothetical protein